MVEMKSALCIAALFAAGCGFNPAGGGGGGDDVGDGGDGDAMVDPDAADPDAPAANDPDAAPGEIDAAVDAIRPDAPAPLICPIGYAPINGSTTQYRIIEINVTWDTAVLDCNDDDDLSSANSGRTHLVVVGDATEKTILTNQFSGNTWVGLSDVATEGTFLWVTSEPTGGFPQVGMEPPWDAGDPDGGTAENCVRFKNSFDFEDKPCTDLNSYVCECDRFAPN